MQPARALRSVVLPAPVPPDTRMLSRAPTAHASRATTAGGAKAARGTARAPKRRTVRQGPSTASGGTMALTRDPSARRASTRGDERSMRSPRGATTFSMRCSMAGVSRTMGTRSSRPARSTHTRPGPLIMTSVTSGSARIGSRGPRPHTSASTSRTIRAWSAGASSGLSPATSSVTRSGSRPRDPSASSRAWTRALLVRAPVDVPVMPPPGAPSPATGEPGRRGARRQPHGRWTGRSRPRPGRAPRARPLYPAG